MPPAPASTLAPDVAAAIAAACLAATHHGEYVSFVAHATQGLPDHGALVSAAAQSDCGKVPPAPTTEAPATASESGSTVTHGKGAAKREEKATARASKREAKTAATAHGKAATHGKSGTHGKGHTKHSH